MSDHDIDAITGEFDLICAFEMIEHVSLEEAHHLLSRCYELNTMGGRRKVRSYTRDSPTG